MIYSDKQNLKWAQFPSGIIAPADCKPKPRPKAFDFFAGCGGFSCGLHQGGFQVIGALEMDYRAAHTYMVNLGNYPMKIHFDTPEREAGFSTYLEKNLKKVIKKYGFIATTGEMHENGYRDIDAFHLTGSGWISNQKHREGCEHFWIADICNMTGKIILDALGMERGELDLVVGSPPCQGFSSINSNRDESDPRNVLAFELARIMTELDPKAIALEEVPEFVSFETPEGINILEGFCKILADGDYASFESLRRSIFGRKGAKAILRSEKKEKIIKPKKEVARKKATQPSLF